MKLTVTRKLGITGLVETLSVDSGALAPDDAHTLRTNVEAADLLVPRPAAVDRTYADAVEYELAVEDAGRSNRVVVSEAQLPPAVRSLITWLESVPGGQRHVGPPADPAGP